MSILCENARAWVIDALFARSKKGTPSDFEFAWLDWAPKINHELGDTPTADSVFALSGHLRDVFLSRRAGERGQDAVANAGNNWESLVCWYLNLALIGSDAVVFKRAMAPKSIQNAVTIIYESVTANSESDLVAVSFPDGHEVLNNALTVSSSLDAQLDFACSQLISKTSLAVIQCKTNWNENAQIPMLWDIVYHSKVPDLSVSVGVKGYHPQSFKRFSYAFATVPTNKTKYNPKRLECLRASRVTGGNYWGKASESGVALQLSEFFSKNGIGARAGTGLREALAAEAANLRTDRHRAFRLASLSPESMNRIRAHEAEIIELRNRAKALREQRRAAQAAGGTGAMRGGARKKSRPAEAKTMLSKATDLFSAD
ncbi:MAG: hypothetical protein K2R93_11020 [Gemmatimonadaceae bacterium]|nr:hypothetical protein [Gemmatimonadaceae bacterium]